MRRRGSFRRRKSGLRWLQPNAWMASNPNLMGSTAVGSTTIVDEFYSDPMLMPIVEGAAPFAGVANSAGLMTGKLLEARQYFKAIRLVGRLNFFWSIRALNESAETLHMPNGGVAAVHWALIRWPTSELGKPLDMFINTERAFSLLENEDQDEKKYIIAQDVWRTNYPVGTDLLMVQNGGEIPHPMAAEPPLYSMFDHRINRWVGNEQQLFIVAQFGVYTPGLSNQVGQTTEISGWALANLRPLVKFGR